MTNSSSVFPIYIRPEYQGSGRAFDNLTSDARRAMDDQRRIFEQGYAGVQDIVARAL